MLQLTLTMFHSLPSPLLTLFESVNDKFFNVISSFWVPTRLDLKIKMITTTNTETMVYIFYNFLGWLSQMFVP